MKLRSCDSKKEKYNLYKKTIKKHNKYIKKYKRKFIKKDKNIKEKTIKHIKINLNKKDNLKQFLSIKLPSKLNCELNFAKYKKELLNYSFTSGLMDKILLGEKKANKKKQKSTNLHSSSKK